LSGQPAANDDEATQSGRTVAEWTTLGISLAILALVFATITWLWVRDTARPATVEVTPVTEDIRHAGDVWYLPLDVVNRGDATAEDVAVEAELDTGAGEPETAEITFSFLASGETARGIVVFTSDPASGDLTIRPVSFKEP
jgi:uncharacterized protein (TIGR02588 family)